MELMLILSVAAMFGLMLTRRNRYNIPLLKTWIIVILVAVLGVLSTILLYFIENGEWDGMSFFGAVLFLPIIFSPISKLFKIPVSSMLDFIAPPGLGMFAVMKINCAISGCCGGIILWHTEKGEAVCFPSAIVEAIITILLVCVLLYFEHKGKTKGKLYPISLVSYGAVRFILNFFRAPGEALLFGMQKGTVWSLVAIISGLLWLFIIAYINLNIKYKKALNQEFEE